MKEHHFEYIAKEYESLRSEMDGLQKHLRTTENFGILISGAFWAWYFSQTGTDSLNPLVKYIPVAVSLLLLIRWVAISQAIVAIGKYQRKIEQRLELPDDFGWEASLARKGNHSLGLYYGLHFSALVFINFAIQHWLL